MNFEFCCVCCSVCSLLLHCEISYQYNYMRVILSVDTVFKGYHCYRLHHCTVLHNRSVETHMFFVLFFVLGGYSAQWYTPIPGHPWTHENFPRHRKIGLGHGEMLLCHSIVFIEKSGGFYGTYMYWDDLCFFQCFDDNAWDSYSVNWPSWVLSFEIHVVKSALLSNNWET